MLSVRRTSVRISLSIFILLTITLSWILSTGLANYFNYLNIRSLHQEMIRHPEIYPRPIPKPEFGLLGFLTGRTPFPRGQGPGPPPRPDGPHMGRWGDPPNGPSHIRFETRLMLLRLTVALGLALLAGTLLGRRYAKPLMQLARGAEAFHSGNFRYRILIDGEDEFAEVATAMNEMAGQVSAHINSLEKDSERRRQFLADIAHELRSPITTMRTMAGALQDGVADDPEKKARAVLALVRISERMQRLVQDLMVLAKLDLNELPMNTKQTDLCEHLNSSIRLHESEANANGIVLHRLQNTSPVIAEVDADRITQVLDNILDNAISYAGEGAEVRASVEDGDPVQISISDTGKGIRTEDLPYIFDSFYRADSARTPGEYHSGLGLSIARRLIEAHGGQLTVSAEEGKGTTAKMSFPKRSGTVIK